MTMQLKQKKNLLKKPTKKLSIGILGGSFNPPHLGHLHISKLAIKLLKLHKILWVISPQNPLKDSKDLENFENRLLKARAITKNNLKIKVSSLEKDFFSRAANLKSSYSYNFLKRLKALHPEYELHFIIGADNLITFHKWYHYKDIMKICKLVVIDREGYKYRALKSKVGLSKNYIYLNTKTMNISSTEIRNSQLVS